MLQNDPELFELSMSEKTQPLMDLVKKHCEENVKPIQQEYSALQNEKEDRWPSIFFFVLQSRIFLLDWFYIFFTVFFY